MKTPMTKADVVSNLRWATANDRPPLTHRQPPASMMPGMSAIVIPKLLRLP